VFYFEDSFEIEKNKKIGILFGVSAALFGALNNYVIFFIFKRNKFSYFLFYFKVFRQKK
jgi:hypothetical protein